MAHNRLRHAHVVAQAIQSEVPRLGRPPEDGAPPETEQVIPHSVVRGTRGYIEKVVHQINGCYERGWFDACAVMVRRLLETVIIEAFEQNGIASKVKNSDGDFFALGDLVDAALSEPSWNLGRNTRRALPKLKGIGDRSAHSRRFNAHLRDLDKHVIDFRDIVQEFIYLARFK